MPWSSFLSPSGRARPATAPAARWMLPRALLNGVTGFAASELRHEGPWNLLRTVAVSAARKELHFVPDRTLGQELDQRARRLGSQTFLSFEGNTYSWQDLNDGAARVAQGLLNLHCCPGAMVGLMLPNLPAFLEIVFATQRIGACAVPINTAWRDAGLRYVLDHAGVGVVFTTAEFLPPLAAVLHGAAVRPQVVLVADQLPGATAQRPGNVVPYAALREGPAQAAPLATIAADRPSLLMYTSGTTGHPKGVIYPYGHSQAKLARFSAHLLLHRDDIYYTCLPLFHANALVITVLHAMYADARVALSRRFSAGNFWREVSRSQATIFNTIGTMIAILMKTEPTVWDQMHRVRRVLSAACPAHLWQPFQKRFGITLWEGFGAVDGGGFTIFNLGNAPVGSVGKPLGRARYRLVDEAGRDVPPGCPGELIHYVGRRRHGQVTYHADADATGDKVRDGWLYSGDLMTRDARGFLYFAGRRTDSMRCRGENVSALEVESVADRYDGVLESAAFGVPSELGEQDVIVVVQPRPGATIDPAALHTFLQQRLPRYAVPRYIRLVDELPKTGTHRTMKRMLQNEGITDDTWRAPSRTGGRRF